MFWAFCVTIFVPLIPEVQQQQVVMFTDSQGVVNFGTLSSTVQGAVNDQSTIPFLELGALIFYSTSILLNLVLNFITAIPQMITLLLLTLFAFLPVSSIIQTNVKMIFLVMLTVIYYLLLIFYITGQRTQTGGFA
jgi:hypothetical protein